MLDGNHYYATVYNNQALSLYIPQLNLTIYHLTDDNTLPRCISSFSIHYLPFESRHRIVLQCFPNRDVKAVRDCRYKRKGRKVQVVAVS